VTKALRVIDLQNDYFPGGKFPLWNTDVALQNIERAIQKANAQGIPMIHIQHIAKGGAPFFNEGTPGAEIHPRILAAAPKAPIVIKEFADSFEKTTLEETLAKLGVIDLLVCGMMTQNCVTHTAISKAAEKYDVTILPDCCTAVSEILHLIALHAVLPGSDREAISFEPKPRFLAGPSAYRSILLAKKPDLSFC
jgi:nicotinamidase-related amidase